MCGVLFITGKKNYSDQEIRNLLLQQKHRGVDDLSFTRHKNFILGSNRLAFNDLSKRANMPMVHGPIEIVFNGEIFNFQDLKKELSEKNDFRNKSDTEVLAAMLHNYDYHGALKKIRGMWSFIAYDKRTDDIIISRDQLGSKPLFYTYLDETLIFASEVKTLLSLKKNIKFNKKKINYYLSSNTIEMPDYCSDNESFFDDIYKFPSNSFTVIKPNHKGPFKIRHITDYLESGDLKVGSKNVDEVENTLNEVFKTYQISDHKLRAVPLSGGIDSTIIAHHLKNDDNVKYFSLLHKNLIHDYDETELINNTVKKYNLNHTFINTNNAISEKNLERIISACDMPIGSVAALFNLKIRDSISSEGIKIFYSGNGADEVFGGHANQFYILLKYLYNNKKYISWILKILTNYSGSTHKNFNLSLIDKLKVIINNFRNWKKIKSRDDEIFMNLIKYNIFWLRGKPIPYFSQLEDGMCSINSLECRTPFLDQNLMDIGLKNYDENSFSNGTNKYLLRKIYRNKLPNHVLKNKVKINLPSPTNDAVFNELFDLSEEYIKKDTYFDNKKLLNQFYKDKKLFSNYKANIKLIRKINLYPYFKLTSLGKFMSLYSH